MYINLILKSNSVVRENICLVQGMFVVWNYYLWKLKNNASANIETIVNMGINYEV